MSDLVGNSDDRFSRDEGHIFDEMHDIAVKGDSLLPKIVTHTSKKYAKIRN